MPLDRRPDQTRNTFDPNLGARTKRIVFIPWDIVEGDEWAIKTAQWNHATGNKYEIVFFNDGRVDPRILKANDQPGSAIYIRGHGNPGVPYIQVKVNVGGDAVQERKIMITEACDRLIRTGLDKRFSGVIKFFHCHSGTVLTQTAYQNEVAKFESNNRLVNQGVRAGTLNADQKAAFWKEIYPNRSIARNGAEYLRKRGFNRCLYYGYLGPLASEYADDGDGGFHKMVEIDGLQNRPTSLAGISSTRASAGRVQV